jgi:hypothetical protein
VLGEDVLAEVAGRVAPDGVRVVRARLRAVVLDEQALVLDVVVVRPKRCKTPNPESKPVDARRQYRLA